MVNHGHTDRLSKDEPFHLRHGAMAGLLAGIQSMVNYETLNLSP